MKRSWRDEYRKCDHCRSEYRPQRQAQSYCSRGCKRAAAYGRERFAAGTTGRRRRRLEASDNVPGIPIAGSVRNGHFFSIETIPCKPTKSPYLGTFDDCTGPDAKSASVGRCCLEMAFRVTCFASPCGSAEPVF